MGKKKTKKLKKLLQITDQGLMEELKADKNVAIKKVVDKYGSKIYCTAYKLTRSHSEAEDVLQDVLLALYKNVDTLKNQKALSSWIYRTTVNYAHMKNRDSKKTRSLISQVACGCVEMTITDLLEDKENAMNYLLDQEARTVLEEAICDLPPIYRNVILLNDFNDFSIRKTSAILNISVPAVKSRLHRARKTLKDKLDLYFKEITN